MRVALRHILSVPYFFAILTLPPTSFRAGRPWMSAFLANVAWHSGHCHSPPAPAAPASPDAPASASAARLASRPAESSQMRSM